MSKLGGSKIDINIHVAAKKSIYTKGDFEKEIESEETNLNEEDWLIDYGKPSVTSILKLMAGSLAARNMIVCSGSDSLKREVSSIVSEPNRWCLTMTWSDPTLKKYICTLNL